MTFVNIHTHVITTLGHKEVFQVDFKKRDLPQESSQLYSIGIHPCDIPLLDIDAAFVLLKEALRKNEVVFVGECGIDRICDVNLEQQKEVLIRQIVIAEQIQKPIILHCVRAYSDILEILKKEQPSIPIVIHGFHGNEQQVRQLLKFNVYFSFGVHFIKNIKQQELIAFIPMGKMFFETDISQEKIEVVYIAAAKAIGVSMETLKGVVSNNFKKIFNV